MKIDLAPIEEIEALSMEIEVSYTAPEYALFVPPQQEGSPINPPKSTKDSSSYFQGKAGSGHGIRINLSGRRGVKSAWLSLSHLLADGDPMETEEMSRAMESLGISDVGKIRVKLVECKALGFRQNFIPPQTLNAKMLEDLSLLSGILAELEEQENTQLFGEFLGEEKVKEVADILRIYEVFQREQELAEELIFEESVELTMTME